MKRLDLHLRKPSTSGIFHDTRKDVQTLSKCINILVDKVNELVNENNKLRKKIEREFKGDSVK